MKHVLIIIIGFCFLIIQTRSQNEVKVDSIFSTERLSLQMDWKSIYYGNIYLLRGSNFVRKIELKYALTSRWSVGINALWGWRFGKNFGEDIGYSVNERKHPISTPYDDKPYSLDEWFYDRVLDYTFYALNYKYRAYGIFVEYQLDKNGIGKIFKRKLHWKGYFGTSYVNGEVAGKLLYTYKRDVGIVPFSSSDYEYYFVYEKINYVNLSLDLKLRLQLEAKSKDWVLPGFSIYYVYAPDQAKNGMKNFGWLWDIRFILWKK